MQLHLKPFLVILGLFFFIACSSSHSSADSDSVSDADRDTQDPPTVVDEDADKDVDLVEDSDRTPDADQDADHDKNEDKDQTVFPDTDSSPDADQVPVTDADEDIACLDLRYNENTIKTPFPFKDANGKPTFCRPGCDTPSENDPQCVRNIWEWDNWEEYQVYLEAHGKNPNQQKERECYPWPCKLPDMHAKTKETLDTFVSSCDRLLTVNGFSADIGTVNSHGMYAGVAGMDFTHTGRIIEYDPEKDEYTTVGQTKGLFGFNENRYVVVAADSIPGDNKDTYKAFVISIFRENGNYKYEIIYDTPHHRAFTDRPPLPGKNWVLIHIRDTKTGKTEIKYASSKDWVWHKLDGITNYAGEGNIVGDHLTFITNNRELYYCDLREYPKHIDECFKLNRKDDSGTEELGHSPRIDLEDEYRVVYNVYRKQIFVEVDFKDQRNPKYTEHTVNKNRETTYSLEIDMLKGSMISYQEFFTLSGGTVDVIGCFYRFDKKKTYCPVDKTTSTLPDSIMGYNVFWGKWHLWKEIAATDAIMRDWECYCQENNVCPLEQ